jgi:nitric oxide reductase subunit C
MPTRARRTLISVLVTVFFVQTWLVYSDDSGRRTAPLSARAARGQAVWQRNNCQSCHQIYGFGGFLGPDLTNVARRLAGDAEDREAALVARLETALTTGSERMPAFHLGLEDRRALAAFFVELDKTGVGQIRVSEARPPRELFDELTAALGELEPPADEGLRLMKYHGCIDCHLPNGKSLFKSTDLTRIHTAVARERIAAVLTDGVPEKGMPRLALTAAEIEAVVACLEQFARHGKDLRQGFESAQRSAGGSLADLPWFEYP